MLTFKLGWRGLDQASFSSVFVLGVKAADGGVLGRVREGPSVYHLPNQDRSLTENHFRLLLG